MSIHFYTESGSGSGSGSRSGSGLESDLGFGKWLHFNSQSI